MQHLQTHASTPFYAAITQRKQRTLLFLACFVLALLVLGALVGLAIGVVLVGVVVGLALGLALALFSYYRSDRIALARSHARPADIGEYQRYHNLVEGLCIAAGLPKPGLYVIDDPARNALVTGRNPKHAALAVTSGLLHDLNRIELEGVLACELSHVKNYDILVSTAAVVPALVLAPLAALLLSGSMTPERELLADASGVRITRYPPGLCSALKKLQADRAVVRHASRATAAMWIASPLGVKAGSDGSWLNRAFDPRPPLEERIRVLEEM